MLRHHLQISTKWSFIVAIITYNSILMNGGGVDAGKNLNNLESIFL